MTLLAARLRIFFFEHRVQPVFMLPVPLYYARGRPAIAPVATRAAKLIRIVNLQQLFIGMTYESARQLVRLFSGSVGRQKFGLESDRLPHAQVTNLAAIYDAELVYVDLVTLD